MDWTRETPTVPGWYIWFREEYDTMRRELFTVNYHHNAPGGSGGLRVFPGNKLVEQKVGGWWYGPIPLPPHDEI